MITDLGIGFWSINAQTTKNFESIDKTKPIGKIWGDKYVVIFDDFLVCLKINRKTKDISSLTQRLQVGKYLPILNWQLYLPILNWQFSKYLFSP